MLVCPSRSCPSISHLAVCVHVDLPILAAFMPRGFARISLEGRPVCTPGGGQSDALPHPLACAGCIHRSKHVPQSHALSRSCTSTSAEAAALLVDAHAHHHKETGRKRETAGTNCGGHARRRVSHAVPGKSGPAGHVGRGVVDPRGAEDLPVAVLLACLDGAGAFGCSMPAGIGMQGRTYWRASWQWLRLLLVGLFRQLNLII